jgi:hypothetical protein
MPSSMHRHNTLASEAPLPVTNHALVSPLDVVVTGRLTKALIGEVSGALKQRIGNVLIHGRMLQRCVGLFNSHFPSPDFLVHVATVAAGSANKNVRGETA